MLVCIDFKKNVANTKKSLKNIEYLEDIGPENQSSEVEQKPDSTEPHLRRGRENGGRLELNPRAESS